MMKLVRSLNNASKCQQCIQHQPGIRKLLQKKKRGGGRGKWQFLFNAEGNGENKQLNVNVQKN